jgi:hypothetical protein
MRAWVPNRIAAAIKRLAGALAVAVAALPAYASPGTAVAGAATITPTIDVLSGGAHAARRGAA